MHIHKPNHSVQKPNVVALSSQEAQWARLATSTNNLANANTPGFKSHMVKLVNTTQKGKEGKVVHFVSSNKSLRNLADGSYRQTGNPLDVSLSGNGYFMVQTSRGNKLTRNGQFALNNNGELVTATGAYKVLDQGNSPIIIPKGIKNIVIHAHGGVYADAVLVGKIGVFSVDDQQEQLRSLGDNLLDPLKQKPVISNKYYIKQFGLEDSNVSSVKESILMIEYLRQFEHAQKIIEEHEQSSKKVLNVSSKNV
jgi:flagellar basal-body rod protein FlgF